MLRYERRPLADYVQPAGRWVAGCAGSEAQV